MTLYDVLVRLAAVDPDWQACGPLSDLLRDIGHEQEAIALEALGRHHRWPVVPGMYGQRVYWRATGQIASLRGCVRATPACVPGFWSGVIRANSIQYVNFETPQYGSFERCFVFAVKWFIRRYTEFGE